MAASAYAVPGSAVTLQSVQDGNTMGMEAGMGGQGNRARADGKPSHLRAGWGCESWQAACLESTIRAVVAVASRWVRSLLQAELISQAQR